MATCRVTKEFNLKSWIGEGGTRKPDQRKVSATAPPVNRMRGGLGPGAPLADNEHGRRGTRSVVDLIGQSTHSGARAGQKSLDETIVRRGSGAVLRVRGVRPVLHKELPRFLANRPLRRIGSLGAIAPRRGADARKGHEDPE